RPESLRGRLETLRHRLERPPERLESPSRIFAIPENHSFMTTPSWCRIIERAWTWLALLTWAAGTCSAWSTTSNLARIPGTPPCRGGKPLITRNRRLPVLATPATPSLLRTAHRRRTIGRACE